MKDLSSTVLTLVLLLFSSSYALDDYRTCRACEWLKEMVDHNEKQLKYFEQEINECRANLQKINEKYESVEELRKTAETVKNDHIRAMDLLAEAQKDYDSLYNLLYPQEDKWLHLDTIKKKELTLREQRHAIEAELNALERCQFLIEKFEVEIPKLRLILDQDREKLAKCSDKHCELAEELDLPAFEIPEEIKTTRAFDVINSFNEQLTKIKIDPPYMSSCSACRELGISLSKLEADVKNDQNFKEAFQKKLDEIQEKYNSFEELQALLQDARSKYQKVEATFKKQAQIFDETIGENDQVVDLFNEFLKDRKTLDQMRATVSELEADYLLALYSRTRLLQIEKELPYKLQARQGMREQFDACRESNCHRRSGIPDIDSRYTLPREIDVPLDPFNGGSSIQDSFNQRFEQAKQQELMRRQNLEAEQRRREQEQREMQQRDLFRPTRPFNPGNPSTFR